MVGPARGNRHREASVPDLPIVRVAKGRIVGQVVIHHDTFGRQGHWTVVPDVEPAGRERARCRVARSRDRQAL